MTYSAPVSEMRFLLESVLDATRLSETERFSEASAETIAAVLTEAAKLSEDVLAPLRRIGDLEPAYLENGVVRTAPGFSDGYRAIADGGWLGMAASPEYGGMGLPLTLTSCVGEMMASANLALSLCPLLSQGQAEALAHHASDELRAFWLPKLISGEWTGTMNLTEPQAGSDVGALRSKAVPAANGTYEISGQKIFISWGDHDVAENIVHVVLARLPGGPHGTRGISLFLVPKFLPDDNGNPGTRNQIRTVSLEHKMGLHGSPTAVLEFEGATGWLVGEEHGGMAAMFTMMNNARLGVAIEGYSQAEAALQATLTFAAERRQGKTALEGEDSILGHADVRRMLARMSALTSGARAICLDCAFSSDMAEATAEKTWADRAAFLTPIAKAFGTDTGCEVSELAIQVHGGMGFIEETGIAQYYRDVRVTTIYEGTNGIQAMDLVARKMMDNGEAANALIAEITVTAREAGDTGAALEAAAEKLSDATGQILGAGFNDRFAGAVPYLRAFALVLSGNYLLKAALADDTRQPLAAFFNTHMLAEVPGLCRQATHGADILNDLDFRT